MGRVVSVIVAVAVAVLIFRVGVSLLRGMVRPMPEPPPSGELRPVKLRYRCPVCGLELRVTSAANEDPIPPRHCMDEMDLVASVPE
jgi:rubredoxin